MQRTKCPKCQHYDNNGIDTVCPKCGVVIEKFIVNAIHSMINDNIDTWKCKCGTAVSLKVFECTNCGLQRPDDLFYEYYNIKKGITKNKIEHEVAEVGSSNTNKTSKYPALRVVCELLSWLGYLIGITTILFVVISIGESMGVFNIIAVILSGSLLSLLSFAAGESIKVLMDIEINTR